LQFQLSLQSITSINVRSRKKVAKSESPDKDAKKYSQIDHETTDVVEKVAEVAPKSSANTEKEVANHSAEVIQELSRLSIF